MLQKLVMSLIVGASVAFFPLSGWGQSADPLADIAKIEILPGWRTDEGHRIAAIRISLAPEWKTYWRAPGDSGIPPRFAWEGSENLQSVRLLWPTPNVFYLNGVRSIGYKDDVIIPMILTAVDPGNPQISLRGEMELGVCRDICVPVNVSLKAKLAGPGQPDPAIRASMADRPATAKEAGVGAVTCSVEPISDGLRLTTRIDLPRMAKKEVTVVELPDQSIWISPAVSTRNGRQLTSVAEMVPPSATPFMLKRSDIRITVLGNGKGVDIQGCKAG